MICEANDGSGIVSEPNLPSEEAKVNGAGLIDKEGEISVRRRLITKMRCERVNPSAQCCILFESLSTKLGV